VQGKTKIGAERLLADAQAVERRAPILLVLDVCRPLWPKRISEQLTIPAIGIGAGVDCDGQVLVIYDMLGVTPASVRASARISSPIRFRP